MSRMGKVDKERPSPSKTKAKCKKQLQERVSKAGSHVKTFPQLSSVSAHFLSSAKVYVSGKYKQCMGITATANVITKV